MMTNDEKVIYVATAIFVLVIIVATVRYYL
jgi:hypothetical protein